MNRVSTGLVSLLLAAALLSGCQLFSNNQPEPTPTLEQLAEVTVGPSATATVATTPTLTATDTPTITSGPATPTFSGRIQFEPGASSAIQQGQLEAGQAHSYLFNAQAQQTSTVEVGSTDGSANFALALMDGSSPLKAITDPDRVWQGELPTSGEYLIIVTASQATTYWLTLTIEPLSEPGLPIVSDPGSPPSDRCVVVHPGGTASVTVYLGPSTAFAPVALLGNWAVILSSEGGWVQVQVGPGQTGWIRETDVGFAGPCDHVNQPIHLEIPTSGSPWRTSNRILPGQAHRYVFQAEANTRLLVDLNSTGDVNFALVGVDSGQPLKRVVNEDRTWEGILPQTQEYILTVVTATEAADYDLLLSAVSAPPLTVIYDTHTEALLGGFQDALWVDNNAAAATLLGGEQYQIYRLGQRVGQATGSAAVPTGIVCPGHTVHLTPAPAESPALAVAGASWDVVPRLVAPVELSQAERQLVVNLLAGQGLTLSADELQVQQALGTDLDGDGTGEIIISATRLRDDGNSPAVDAGDYALVAVLMEIGGQQHIEPLALDTYTAAQDLAYPWRYQATGTLDLNGDGNLEIAVAGTRWEGRSTTVYSVGASGGATVVLERRCTG